MKKSEFKRRLYLRPELSVIEVDEEQFICTSVEPDAGSSTEAEENTEWEERYYRNSGEFQI